MGKIGLIILCCFPFFLNGQDNSKFGTLTFKYFKVARIQSGGNVDVQLNKNFDFLKIFKKGQRFAPDEPSTFSSLEFTFLDKNLPKEKWSYEQSLGVFRNHFKGDFLLDEFDVHFGLGNSQVGVSTTATLNCFLMEKIKMGVFAQVGIGPHFTRYESYAREVDPDGWGTRGFGHTLNMGLQVSSPKFWNRFSIQGFVNYQVATAYHKDFTVEAIGSEPINHVFTNPRFTATSENLIFSIALSFDILKKK